MQTSTIVSEFGGGSAFWDGRLRPSGLVNTIRRQLKRSGINNSWTEIVRIGNTQKVITTKGYNKAGKEIVVRKCSEPEIKLKALQLALKMKHRPFTKLKSVVHKPKLKNPERSTIRELPPS